MRLALLTHEPFHPPSGGGSAEAIYLVREFVRGGHQVHVFCPEIADAASVSAESGIRLHSFTGWKMGRYTRWRNLKYLLYPFGLERSKGHGEQGELQVRVRDRARHALNNAFISQTGTIPPAARSLQLLAKGPFQLFVGGVDIPMHVLRGNGYGGDVSGFAGAVVELKIVNTGNPPHQETVVDNIRFSGLSVPEPGVWALLAVGVRCGRSRLECGAHTPEPATRTF